MLGVPRCSRIASRCFDFKSIIRSADNIRNQQGTFAPANKRRHFLHHFPRCLHGCRAAAARMPGRRAPPHPPTPPIHCCGIFCGAAHARHFQTVYLQQWLANRQLVSFFEPCDNVQKKGFLSIAKSGAPASRQFFPPASRLLHSSLPSLKNLSRGCVELAAGTFSVCHQRRVLLRAAAAGQPAVRARSQALGLVLPGFRLRWRRHEGHRAGVHAAAARAQRHLPCQAFRPTGLVAFSFPPRCARHALNNGTVSRAGLRDDVA